MPNKKTLFNLTCRFNEPRRAFLKYVTITAMLYSCICFVVQGGSHQTTLTDSSANVKLLDDYVKAKGYTDSIVFDSTNIKQFWIEKSVLSRNETINIFLEDKTNNGFESVPLKIKLVNVNESQDCTVEVIADSNDVEFSILNNKSGVLATSSAEQPFIQYYVVSSTIHLEDTSDNSFSLKFASRTKENISIRKIILSFSNNPNTSFLSSPGILKINRDGIYVSSATIDNNSDNIEFKGKNGTMRSKKNILVSNKNIETSVKIKNIGDTPTQIWIGFAVCTKDRVVLDLRHYPYNNQVKTLTVVSSEAGSNKIVVDSYSDWTKNCHLALDAENDLSDIPNTNFADGKIVEIKELDDGNAEITMDTPFKTALKTGMKVRIHGKAGGYRYTNFKILQPNEEEVFVSSFSKEDLSPNGISRGIYFVTPLILSHSVDANKENTILISDYSISY